jgi:hypothetical protein
MSVAPVPATPEKPTPIFERSMAPSIPMNRGPRYFEEGVANDTDVPYDFGVGSVLDGQSLRPTTSRKSPEVMIKPANQTMRERAHVGSASWVEAPSVLSEFAEGAMAGDMPTREFTIVRNPGTHMARPNASQVG